MVCATAVGAVRLYGLEANYTMILGGLSRMVNLTVYGGVDEIGGNKVLLEDGDVRVFFDFGQSVTMEVRNPLL